MKTLLKNKNAILLAILLGIFVVSCAPGDQGRARIVDENPPLNKEDIIEETPLVDNAEVSQTISQVIENQQEEYFELLDRENLRVIDQQNVRELQELAVIYPYFPAYDQISPNGRTGAVGGLNGIDILDITSGDLIDQIPVELPVSDFGLERYFQLNHDGSFIAIATKNEIQVWQIGGGLIFIKSYSREFNTTASIFGADIPQLALSPDGTLLAVSGIDFSAAEVEQYFQVIDILKNTIIYDWNGSDDDLHGKLYEYPALGFSADGNVIQTFDPVRYAPLSGSAHSAFRFWSTDDWRELDPFADIVQNAFDPEGLLFALHSDLGLTIRDRSNGKEEYNLERTGCSFDYPCSVELSNNTKFGAIIDYTQETLIYRRDLIAKEFQIWDLEKGERIGTYPLGSRNLDGVQINDNGSYIVMQQGSGESEAGSVWWTSATNFAGLAEFKNRIIFSPLSIGLDTSDCYYCGTCQLDLDEMQVVCREDYVSQEGNAYQLETGKSEKETSTEELISLPVEIGQGVTARVLGITDKWRKAFYCEDQNQRQQQCVFYDMDDEAALNVREDIYALRFSPEGDYAIFIDRLEKALYVTDLETGKLSEINAYQSRAWPVNPAFTNNGTELVYMIQNNTAKDVLSLEWVNAEGGRVLRRSNLETGLVGSPSALAWEAEKALVAVGNTDGWIYMMGQEKGKLQHSWHAENEAIIGIYFTWEGKLLISLSKTGIIRFWGVLK